MNFAKPFGSAEIDKSAETEVEGNIRELTRGSTVLRQADSSDGEMTANNLSTLLRRVSGSSTRQIDNLIGELRTLREKLQSDGDRVQRDIVEYAALSQSVMQLTKIVAESVKNLPDEPSRRRIGPAPVGARNRFPKRRRFAKDWGSVVEFDSRQTGRPVRRKHRVMFSGVRSEARKSRRKCRCNHSLTILTAALPRQVIGRSRMNIITMASRKGGAGKSTLTAHLAAFSQQAGHRCVVIDADPQGSLTLWHSLRADGNPPLRSAARGVDRALAYGNGRGLRVGLHRHRRQHVGGGAGGDPRGDLRAHSGAPGLLRSQCRARNGRHCARTRQTLRGRAQCRAGEARRQGSSGGHAVEDVLRQARHPGLVGPDQSTHRLRAYARRRRAAYARLRPNPWPVPRSRGCGRQSSAPSLRSTKRAPAQA